MFRYSLSHFYVFFLFSFCVNEINATDNCDICHEDATSSSLVAKFENKICGNEFIVVFKNFYWPETRKNFLSAALKKANLTMWKVIPRFNDASSYPSDFDVLNFSNSSIVLDTLLGIEAHPAIKTVTYHRSVHRTLNYMPIENKTNSDGNNSYNSRYGRQLLRVIPHQVTNILKAHVLWKMGITGSGIKVAIFDTGLAKDHPHFKKVKERTNWTNEKSLDDGVSHGTFVAGVIASSKDCLGLAPDAELHIYRVFTNTQVSYTSWFLDAFNYAIFKKINVLNLSIGGPDFLDRPFVDKVLELSANKVIMVSAIGNDGPLYGTLNNPGDQSDVVGVGGINFDEKVAKFSSRGMTTWEMPLGYGRLKPDIVTYGSQVQGSNVRSGCRSLSGTSVASPVVAGAIALISSGALNKLKFINPSSIKQVLLGGASRLNDNNMFEQGHGKLDILKSMDILSKYTPKVTLSPAYLDFADNFMWPYSSQPLFCGSMPVIINVTILNGISVTGKIMNQPEWHAYENKHGHLLNVAISYSSVLWPWSGWMALHIGIKEAGCDFEGAASGHIVLNVQNPSYLNENEFVNSTVYFPISINVIKKPPKHKRILWDQYHSLRYPPGYIPRDNLKMKSDPLDWRGDHIHTNFRDMYIHLRNSGYYIDTLRLPYTCFNASEYGTLLVVDPEEEFFDEEIFKIQNDVYDNGLSIIVFADWYNTTVMKKIKFFDENTRQWWIPDTGGSNIPALNEFLKPFDIALNDFVAEGHFNLGDHAMYYASGTTLANFPENSDNIVIGAELNDQGSEIIEGLNSVHRLKTFLPILGLHQAKRFLRKENLLEHSETQSSYEENVADKTDFNFENLQVKNPIINKRILLSIESNDKHYSNISQPNNYIYQNNNARFRFSEGRIAIYGDSGCIDSTHSEKACFWLLDAFLDYTMNSHKSGLLRNFNRISEFKTFATKTIPLRLSSSNLYQYSKVLDSKNKFKKKKSDKCEVLHWVAGYLVNFTDTNFKKVQTLENIQNIHEKANDYQSIKDPDMQTVMDSKSKSMAKHLNLFEDTSINFSLIFVIVLTLIILGLLLKWFKRRKLLKFSVLR